MMQFSTQILQNITLLLALPYITTLTFNEINSNFLTTNKHSFNLISNQTITFCNGKHK